jgi:hypothetical protein
LEQLTLWSEEHPVNHFQSQGYAKGWKTQEETLPSSIAGFLTTLDPSGAFGKTCRVSSVAMVDGTLVPSSGRWQNSGMGSHTECLTLSTSEWPKDAAEVMSEDKMMRTGAPGRHGSGLTDKPDCAEPTKGVSVVSGFSRTGNERVECEAIVVQPITAVFKGGQGSGAGGIGYSETSRQRYQRLMAGTEHQAKRHLMAHGIRH